MLRFINRKIALQWVLLLGLLALAVYAIITQTQLANEEGAAFLYRNFARFFSQYELFGKGIIITILLLQVLFLQYYFTKNEFTHRNSLLPACFYLSILLLTNSLIIISPLFFTLLFFLITISINYTATSEKLKSNVFWAGILIALGTCFDISSSILLVLVVVILIINQFFKIKEIGILLFGFTLVYLYFFSYYFFTNSFCEWMLTFEQIKILEILNGEFSTGAYISLISLAVLYLFLSIKSRLISESKVVVVRKRTLTFNACAILLIACLFISNTAYPHVLGYLFAPLAIYLAILAQEKSPFFINEIITTATLIILWL